VTLSRGRATRVRLKTVVAKASGEDHALQKFSRPRRARARSPERKKKNRWGRRGPGTGFPPVDRPNRSPAASVVRRARVIGCPGFLTFLFFTVVRSSFPRVSVSSFFFLFRVVFFRSFGGFFSRRIRVCARDVSRNPSVRMNKSYSVGFSRTHIVKKTASTQYIYVFFTL